MNRAISNQYRIIFNSKLNLPENGESSNKDSNSGQPDNLQSETVEKIEWIPVEQKAAEEQIKNSVDILNLNYGSQDYISDERYD